MADAMRLSRRQTLEDEEKRQDGTLRPPGDASSSGASSSKTMSSPASIGLKIRQALTRNDNEPMLAGEDM
eukprot:16447130-Heterocapsa_arctica.AAC.1